MAAQASLTFVDNLPGTADQIIRSSGNWTTDGFVQGVVLTISGSIDNDDSFYEVASVNTVAVGGNAPGTVLTLAMVDASDDVNPEAGTTQVSVTAKVITRTVGSFVADGFAGNQQLTVRGTGIVNC